MEFTTYDYLDEIFKEDLGIGLAPDQTSAEMDCREGAGMHVISNNKIQCYLKRGNISTTPPEPAIVKIPIEKDISTGTNMQVNASFFIFLLKELSR